MITISGHTRSLTIAMSTVVEEWLTNCNGLRKRRLSKSINKLLSDPYLWLCLKHSEEAVNDTLGNPKQGPRRLLRQKIGHLQRTSQKV